MNQVELKSAMTRTTVVLNYEIIEMFNGFIPTFRMYLPILQFILFCVISED